MAPSIPDEVDVFSLPHSRMKELVDDYVEMIQSTNFSSVADMELLLESLYKTFLEFRTHEQIENRFIMKRLKSKLKELSVEVSAVCNCHKDSSLTDMIGFIKDGHTKTTEQDRINYGRQLRQALDDFTSDFLPHMQEEEEVFQPLLLKYFTYAELCRLKKKVITQHFFRLSSSFKPGMEKWISDLTQKENFDFSSESSDDDDVRKDSRYHTTINDLPPELLHQVLCYLSPRDLCRASGVSHRWREHCYDPTLWPSFLPKQWSQGLWSFQDEATESQPAHTDCEISIPDEDADVDETENLPSSCLNSHKHVNMEVKILTGFVGGVVSRVGCGVKKVVLANCMMLTTSLVQKLLNCCPNIRHLDLSYTRISDGVFKKHSLQNLERLDLTGCSRISDRALINVSMAMSPITSISSGFLHDLSALSAQPCVCKAVYELTDAVLQEDFCMTACQSTQETTSSLGHDNEQVELSYVKHSLDPDRGKQVHFSSHPASHVSNGDSQMLSQAVNKLSWLSFSGCCNLTDVSIRSLTYSGPFPCLTWLDLSGCFNLSGSVIASLVKQAQSLQPESLFYCDNILDGPYPAEASGCQNVECDGRRLCCRCGE